MKGITDHLKLRQLNIASDYIKEFKEIPEELKNYDFVHSNIGSRPTEIDNKVL